VSDGELSGGRFASPVRRDQTVERQPGPGRAYVHDLLRYLESAGFQFAPRYMGMTADGRREVLSYIAGEIGFPPFAATVRSDDALVSVSRAIRALHDAAVGFEPSSPGPAFTHDVCVPDQVDCVGHGDLAPWNFVFRGTEVAGIIDWDSAGPTSRAWDLCYAAYQLVPLMPGPDLEGWGWNLDVDRRRRLALFAETYDAGIAPAELVDLAIVRLVSMAARMEREISLGNPAYSPHRKENHAEGYRRAAKFLIEMRGSIL
jgi:hypothetical protein